MKIPYLEETKLRKLLIKNNIMTQDINLAIELVIKYFSHVTRDDGASYLNEHIFPVAAEVLKYLSRFDRVNEEVLVIALLHDLLEDTDILEEELKSVFPQKYSPILKGTKILTKSKHVSGSSYEEKLDYSIEYVEKISQSPDTIKVIKIMDRINNLSCIHKARAEKQRFYFRETEKVYLPLALHQSSLLYKRMLKILKKQQKRYKKLEKNR